MSKELKQLIRQELVDQLSELEGGMFISFSGMNGSSLYGLRSSLHEQGISVTVVPNRITRWALGELGIEGEALDEVLRGETALVRGETPVETARILRGKIRQGTPITIKGAILERQVLGPSDAQRVADLPTREEVLAQMAACFQGGAQRIATCFQQTYRQLAGLYQTVVERLEEGQPLVAGASIEGGTNGGESA